MSGVDLPTGTVSCRSTWIWDRGKWTGSTPQGDEHMWIHTVMKGETLRGIADEYNTSTRELLHLNELQNENVLAIGQHLLIPGPAMLAQVYTLQSGDTRASVARKAGVTQKQLEQGLGPMPWNAGSRIPIPARITQKRAIEVNGYLVPDGTASDARTVREVADRMTYLCIFSYQAKADGTLTPRPDTEAVNAARKAGVQPLMTLTNFDGTNFNTELAHTLMANASLRRKLVQNAVTTARQRGFKGINVDFEHMRPDDRQLYNTFVKELGAACRQQKLSISIAMGPKTSDDPTAAWMGAFDYQTLGEEVDFLMLMTYEWGWVGGPPMAT